MRVFAVGVAASLASAAVAQPSTQSANINVDTPVSFMQGDTVTLTVRLDGAQSGGAMGFAGWNIGVDVFGATVAGANYVTAAGPLIDQNEPFTPGFDFEISGGTIELNEGLNAFDAVNGFHTGGALVEITLDTSASTDDIQIFTRRGSSSLGAFTAALPGQDPFSFIGQEFEGFLGTYSSDTITFIIPAPASVAVLGLGGLAMSRRRR